ncbi:helix-turn-helix domain-containing protein [Spiroplasma endosymbiont of Nebria brevicollis]|uniref:helix-turn-helix domain-containing protein n=1 Tax=Spiroplasma endosymbiont of Nebria brevicollis TaxID=3066284 RepID=UPI00313EA0D3
MLKKVEGLGCITASKILNVDKSSIKRWRKSIRTLGEDSLIPGKGIQSKGKRQGRPKTLDLNEMTKEELIQYIEVMNYLKKYLEISTKGKCQAIS